MCTVQSHESMLQALAEAAAAAEKDATLSKSVKESASHGQTARALELLDQMEHEE